MNGLLQLSEREAEVLALLMQVDNDWSPVLQNDIKNILSTDSRRAIMQETYINKNNLSKYIKLLKEKGLVYETAFGGYEVSPSIMPVEKNNFIEVLFTLEIGE